LEVAVLIRMLEDLRYNGSVIKEGTELFEETLEEFFRSRAARDPKAPRPTPKYEEIY
jgi:hypothetical protein